MDDKKASTSPPPPPHRRSLEPLPGLTLRQLDDARVVERIKVMDRYNFPVSYHARYYAGLTTHMSKYCQIALFHDLLVGSCMCRLERTDLPPPETPVSDGAASVDVQGSESAVVVADGAGGDSALRLYVMTIGVLEPYRRMGIAARLLQRVLDLIPQDADNRITHVALHLQVGSPALGFYESFGFTQAGIIKEYYKNLDCCDALVMTRQVVQPAFAATAAAAAGASAAAPANAGKKKGR